MSTYRDYAYERTIVARLQRMLLEQFLPMDSAPKETLICEEVFRNDSEVPQEAFLRTLTKLQAWESDLRAKMIRFEWREEERVLPFLDSGTKDVENGNEEDPEEDPKSAEQAAGSKGNRGRP